MYKWNWLDIYIYIQYMLCSIIHSCTVTDGCWRKWPPVRSSLLTHKWLHAVIHVKLTTSIQLGCSKTESETRPHHQYILQGFRTFFIPNPGMNFFSIFPHTLHTRFTKKKWWTRLFNIYFISCIPGRNFEQAPTYKELVHLCIPGLGFSGMVDAASSSTYNF